ncbi:MAG: SPASM domain-containing protein [Waltera sp.]
MVVEESGAVYPCDFFCLDAYKLGTIQNDTLQSLLTGEKMRTFITDGWQIPAECQQCKWVRLCRGGCKRDRNTAAAAQRSCYCNALQKFFAYTEPRLYEMIRAVQMYH